MSSEYKGMEIIFQDNGWYNCTRISGAVYREIAHIKTYNDTTSAIRIHTKFLSDVFHARRTGVEVDGIKVRPVEFDLKILETTEEYTTVCVITYYERV